VARAGLAQWRELAKLQERAAASQPDRRRIAMVMFARGGDNRPAVIATAARTIYDGFAGRSGLAASFPGLIQTSSSDMRMRQVREPQSGGTIRAPANWLSW